MYSLSPAINTFADAKVLVIGDIILDRFTYGKIERISPEASVPIFEIIRQEEMLGGAGNVAANLRALSCRVNYVGLIGNDAEGSSLAKLLKGSGMQSHLIKPDHFHTIVKNRLIAGDNHIFRVDREGPAPDFSANLPVFLRSFRRLAKQADIVLLSDYGKGLLTADNTPQLIEICHELGKRIIVDPKGNDYNKYRGATLVKPNLKEFAEVTGETPFDPGAPDFHERIRDAALKLIDRYHFGNLLITLGEEGMALVSAEEPTHVQRISARAGDVFAVSGAGDTCLATLGAALACDVPLPQAMYLANLASGIAVGKVGTATVSADELRDALEENNPGSICSRSPERKIMSLPQAEKFLAELRGKGKIIGFTNGVFDCCHMGHLLFLLEAGKTCDVLVVAVNSDASVKRLKGEERPLQDEATRSLLLASLEYVSCVVVFEEDTPLEVVKALRPDVLVKGGYTIDCWPEAQYARQYGAKIVALERVGNYSTTNMINKIK